MKKIGVIYGSTTGTCENIAHKVAKQLNIEPSNIIDVADVTIEQLNSYDVLLLGSSTWGLGELQDDWYDGINKLKAVNLNGKHIGFFGCGDSYSYADTFCDAIGLIYNEIADSGCNIVGKFPIRGYSYDNSVAEIDGELIGVAIDDVNEDNMTDERIVAWLELVKSKI